MHFQPVAWAQPPWGMSSLDTGDVFLLKSKGRDMFCCPFHVLKTSRLTWLGPYLFKKLSTFKFRRMLRLSEHRGWSESHLPLTSERPRSRYLISLISTFPSVNGNLTIALYVIVGIKIVDLCKECSPVAGTEEVIGINPTLWILKQQQKVKDT